MTDKRLLELAYYGALSEYGAARKKQKAFPNNINLMEEEKRFAELEEISRRLYNKENEK